MKSIKETLLDLYVTVLIKHKHVLEGKQHEEYPKRYQVRLLIINTIEKAKNLGHLEFLRNYLDRFEAKIGEEDHFLRFLIHDKTYELTKTIVEENEIIKYTDAIPLQNTFQLENNKITIQPSWCGPYIN
jgi:hypothetical protein